jgi:thiamine-monophosphate kinase
MNNSEFDIIKKYFTFPVTREDVLIAGGDDCASVCVPVNKQLLITTDTLIAGVHFPLATSAEDIAYKSLMVNLSDLAAMGATPAWVTLAISLPEVDESWLAAFSQQLYAVLSRFNVSLIGGDTTRGPLSITIQAMGLCDKDKVLRRDRAVAGDKLFVTGELGDAFIGLRAVLDGLDDIALLPCIDRLNRPEARVSFAEQLTQYSVCAIDVSDGLIADLGHILKASHCGALVDLSKIPLSSAVQHYFRNYHNNTIDWPMVLTQGDDYELCFTLDEKYHAAVIALAESQRLRLSCIGEITESGELLCLDEKKQAYQFTETGFKHF